MSDCGLGASAPRLPTLPCGGARVAARAGRSLIRPGEGAGWSGRLLCRYRSGRLPAAALMNEAVHEILNPSVRRYVPDGARISVVGDPHGGALGHIDVEELGVVGCPARGGDLDQANAVEGPQIRIELRVLPVGGRDRRPDVVGLARVRDVDGVAHRLP
jgi:hypothetical protein